MLFAKKPVEFIVAGLGNPEQKYCFTRHNAGFLAIDSLASKYGCRIGSLKHRGLCGSAVISDKKVLLVKPQTYMNSSGECIAAAARYYGVPAERIIIICDDCALPVGQIRIRRKGSDGGHNGLKNIIAHLGTDAFPRVKVGVGAPENPEHDIVDWVVGNFSAPEKKVIDEALDKALRCWQYIKQNLIDHERGEWFWSRDRNGLLNLKDDHAGFWKCPYHNSRMCLELIERIGEAAR